MKRIHCLALILAINTSSGTLASEEKKTIWPETGDITYKEVKDGNEKIIEIIYTSTASETSVSFCPQTHIYTGTKKIKTGSGSSESVALKNPCWTFVEFRALCQKQEKEKNQPVTHAKQEQSLKKEKLKSQCSIS